MIIGKKAMGVGQVFIFIVAAITFALIMIFGYKAISGFVSTGEDVAFVQFKTDLENSVRKIYTEYGAVRIESFSVPSEFEQVCFVDLNEQPNEALKKIDSVAYAVWQDAQESGKGYNGADENVFLIPPAPVKIKVFDIKMDNNYLCMNILRGQFSLALQGQGDHTRLVIPDNEN